MTVEVINRCTKISFILPLFQNKIKIDSKKSKKVDFSKKIIQHIESSRIDKLNEITIKVSYFLVIYTYILRQVLIDEWLKKYNKLNNMYKNLPTSINCYSSLLYFILHVFHTKVVYLPIINILRNI